MITDTRAGACARWRRAAVYRAIGGASRDARQSHEPELEKDLRAAIAALRLERPHKKRRSR